MKKPLHDVRRFHLLAGQAINEPMVPEASFDDPHALAGHGARCREAAEALAARGASAPAARRLPLLRARLMLEELGETLEALSAGDRTAVADGLADLIYVTVGTAVSYGLPLDRVWDEVQRANIEKFPPCPSCGGDSEETPFCYACSGLGRVAVKDEAGKVLKPEGWTPPDLSFIRKEEVMWETITEEVERGDLSLERRIALYEKAVHAGRNPPSRVTNWAPKHRHPFVCSQGPGWVNATNDYWVVPNRHAASPSDLWQGRSRYPLKGPVPFELVVASPREQPERSAVPLVVGGTAAEVMARIDHHLAEERGRARA